MPPRKARSSVQSTSKRKTANQKHRKRHLDAYAIAGKVTTEKSAIRNHRLGVAENNEPKQKRRRTDDEEEEGASDDENDPRQNRMKRAKQEQDGDVEFGSDSEGNEWVVGGLMDDDDESIDSDEAFGESDEERFEGFTFRGSKSMRGLSKPKARSSSSKVAQHSEDVDLNEADDVEDEEEDDFGDEGVDLATMLDDDADSESQEENDESSDGEEEQDSVTDDEDLEEHDPERHARLQDFVEGLDKKAGKNTTDTEGHDDYKITMDDLLDDVDLDSNTLATLRPKKKSKAPQMVKPLLPKRQQDTINREVATKKAKEQLDRWRDTVIHNRRAEFLSFPLKHPDEATPLAKDTFAPTQFAAPATDLEANIQKIMEESGLSTKTDGKYDESDLLKAEELAVKDLPVEEVLRRRAELRRNRELLFREEIKAKRIAKIKSKSYRRVHRKERERMADKERMLMDPEGFANGDLDEGEQDVADRRRAEARMNAKHKTSKWAKSLRATDRTLWDTEARDSVFDQARRQEELKQRIAGKDVVDDDNASLSEDNEDDDDNVARQLDSLQAAETPKAGGLAGMKFMLAADSRRKQLNDEALAELEKELRGGPDEEEQEVQDEGLGRAIFGPRPGSDKTDVPQKQKRPELEEGDLSEDAAEPVIEASAATETKRTGKGEATTKSNKRGPLAAAVSLAGKPELQLNQPPKLEETSIWLSAPREKKSKLDRRLARRHDEEAIISTDLTTTHAKDAPADKSATVAHTNAPNTNGWAEVQGPATDDSEHEIEEAPMLTKAEQNAAFHARAFAGDDVALQFDAEKDALAATEDEHEVNTSMPGWGAWTGSGLSKSVRKAAQRIHHNPLYKTKLPGTRPGDRKDAKLANVIISEKSNRKGKKYLAPMLPHQFERKAEYERSLRMPIGPEWTTKEVFQRSTRPRVVVKPGTIIEPISRPLV